MASIKQPESTPCQFDRSWIGKCGKPTDNGWCDEHDNKKCVCCGKKAVRDCGTTMGPLCCGAMLCSDCCHSPSGSGHVTKKVAEEMYKQEAAEREATEASRTSPVQRLDENGCPLNLFELLKGDESSYVTKPGYFAQLEHGLMGFFPAIFADDPKRIVVTLDRELLCDVVKTLTPRRFRISENLFYVIEDQGVAYANIDDKERSVPDRFLTREEFTDLTAKNEKPFEWAPGLIGNDMSPEEFADSLRAVAVKCS